MSVETRERIEAGVEASPLGALPPKAGVAEEGSGGTAAAQCDVHTHVTSELTANTATNFREKFKCRYKHTGSIIDRKLLRKYF